MFKHSLHTRFPQPHIDIFHRHRGKLPAGQMQSTQVKEIVIVNSVFVSCFCVMFLCGFNLAFRGFDLPGR